jgi:hypothetical protein
MSEKRGAPEDAEGVVLQDPRDRAKAALPCVVLSDFVSLIQWGGSRTTSLGHPAYPRPKGTGDQSMPEKRRQARSASRTFRKTRVTRSRFDYLKSNPDRDISCPLTRERNP